VAYVLSASPQTRSLYIGAELYLPCLKGVYHECFTGGVVITGDDGIIETHHENLDIHTGQIQGYRDTAYFRFILLIYFLFIF
jgi:hypothetical protein